MGSLEPSPFGILLRRYRARLGLTQHDLAERAMISARTVSDLERGVIRHPYPHTARQLADALQLLDEGRRQFLQLVGDRPSCGASVRPQTPGREERKVVSILFVDLVGFASRSDHADPENVRDLLRAYYSHVKERIERLGGTAEQFIGTVVLAVFGAPLSHADASERAVRAGLKVLEAVEELNQALPGLELAARAAVSSGEALVAIGSGPDRAAALGDIVNIASTLQASAPTGRLVVGEETYRATRDVMHYEALPPMVAKGKSEPLPVWLVRPVQPKRVSGISGER